MDNNKTEVTEWEPTGVRFVAVLDIMGFKDRVARKTSEEILDEMKRFSKLRNEFHEQTNYLHDQNILVTTCFSDSIFIFSKDKTIVSLEALVYLTIQILSKAASDKIPMKGAIAEGKLTVDVKEQIYFGQPLIDAHLLQEDEVDYYGVVCHNSMESSIADYRKISSEIDCSFKEILTPLKSGKISHLNLNWFKEISKLDGDKSFASIIKNFKTMTSGKPRKYIDNTEEVFGLFYPIVTK